MTRKARQMKDTWLAALALIAILAGPVAVWAQQKPRIHVVLSDFGGRIDRRAALVEMLRTRGDRVEIRGRVCMSACTLYLGADNVCVGSDTVFGFHGPSLWGLSLDAHSFEYWSQLIASHYRPPLRDWYLNVARHRLHGFHRISGRQVIALGYQPCAVEG